MIEKTNNYKMLQVMDGHISQSTHLNCIIFLWGQLFWDEENFSKIILILKMYKCLNVTSLFWKRSRCQKIFHQYQYHSSTLNTVNNIEWCNLNYSFNASVILIQKFRKNIVLRTKLNRGLN